MPPLEKWIVAFLNNTHIPPVQKTFPVAKSICWPSVSKHANCLAQMSIKFEVSRKNTQFCRIKRCGSTGCPPPIIFERLKLPQQIIYRRNENLSESPNHQKYWENFLVSRFYEQFSRNRRNLGHFRKFEKISNS